MLLFFRLHLFGRGFDSSHSHGDAGYTEVQHPAPDPQPYRANSEMHTQRFQLDTIFCDLLVYTVTMMMLHSCAPARCKRKKSW